MRKFILLLCLSLATLTYGQLAPPIDFESTTITYTFTNFDGGNASVITNPQSSGINTSGNVGQMIKGPGGQPWGGAFLTMAASIDFSTNKIFKMKVYSPRVGARVLLKVENGMNGGIFFEKEDTSSVANAWEELTFDFTAINTANTYEKIVLIWDLGTAGDGTANYTFLFDDIQLVAGGPSLQQIDLPITFEDPAVDYTVTDFGGNATQVVVDPTNASNMVAQSDKTAAAQLWAGTTMSTPAGLATALPFSATDTEISIRVWSPDANIPVRLKAEDHTNPTISVETETMTTVAMAWDTLVFDFSNEVMGTAALDINNTYDMLSVFFNFGTDGATAGAKTYYWDDVTWGMITPALDQIDLPITFEDANVDYTVTDFGGNASMVVVDPTDPTNMVAQSDKTAAAQLWAGTTASTPAGLANAIPFTATATEMTIRVWSPDAGIPIRLKAEDHTNPTISVETEAMTTVASAWETLTFDFSNEVSGTAALDINNTYDMVSIFFNFGTDGATAGAKTYYWDDVMFGAPVNPLAQIDMPVTFEDTMTVDYTMTDFGGNASQVVIDPTSATNTVAEVIKTDQAQTWAGTTIGTPPGFATAIPFAATETKISVKVWSPDAGIPILLKAEDHTDGTISVETETMTTMASAWETLVFDFSNNASGTPALDINETYDMLSIFFNFGTDGATAGQKTYYFDDVEFGVSTSREGLLDVGLSYYPNPVTGILNVQAERPIENIRVLNTMGQEVLNVVPNSLKATADLSQFDMGLYIIVATVNGQTQTFKVIKR